MSVTVKKKNRRSNPWLIIGIIVIVLAIGVAVYIANPFGTSNAQAVNKLSTIAVKRGNIIGTVSGSGSITPDKSLDLQFQTNGIVKDVMVKDGDVVKTGQTLATLDDRDLQSRVMSAQASLDSARAQLAQRQKGNGTPADIASAQAALESAEASYTAALNTAAASDSTLLSLKASLDKAQTILNQAQSAYDRIGGDANPNIGLLPQSRDLQNATIDYQRALADYQARLKTSGTDAQKTIAGAKASLESAKANLAKLTAPSSDNDIAIAQANVFSAEQALKQAQLNLERATLKAPFDGVIAKVSIVTGSNSTGNVMRILNRDPLRIELKLSENDVVRAALGQSVALTIDSLSDWKATGTVNYIAPAADTTNSVVTYAVRVTFSDTDSRVKIGMTANVDIIVARKDNVLLVPNSALLPKGSGRVVQMVSADGKVKEVEVVTGISDNVQTEIISGLNEGDKIVGLPGTTTRSTNPFGPPQ